MTPTTRLSVEISPRWVWFGRGKGIATTNASSKPTLYRVGKTLVLSRTPLLLSPGIAVARNVTMGGGKLVLGRGVWDMIPVVGYHTCIRCS